jgi:hypothetical protein
VKKNLPTCKKRNALSHVAKITNPVKSCFLLKITLRRNFLNSFLEFVNVRNHVLRKFKAQALTKPLIPNET